MVITAIKSVSLFTSLSLRRLRQNKLNIEETLA